MHYQHFQMYQWTYCLHTNVLGLWRTSWMPWWKWWKPKHVRWVDHPFVKNYRIWSYRSLITFIFKANWTCDAGKFTCGNGHPRCISQARSCNKLRDCSDGSDENAALCGKCLAVYRAGGLSFARFWRREFGKFPRLVGRFCSYQLPKQVGGTPQILFFKT